MWRMNTASAAHPDPIRGVVRVLMAYRDQTQGEVILATGIPKSTFIRRMQHGHWTVDEVRSLARHFDVSVATLLDGPDALLGGGSRSVTAGTAAGNRRATPRTMVLAA